MPYLKNNLRCLWALALMTVLAVSATTTAQEVKAEKKKLPPANWVRSRKIDVKHIALDMRFDWQKKQAYGTAAVTFAPLNSTNTITLDAGMLTINSITLANRMPLKFNYDGGDKNDGLAITLDRSYKAGEDLTVKIDYHTNWINQIDPNSLGGSNGKGLRFSVPTSNDPNKPREIWSIGEPESNRYWFPSYDAPNDFRTTEFIATVDKKQTVISNGKLITTKNNTDGTRTFHWKMDTPYANHLTSFVVGEYVDVKQNYDGIALHNFGYPNETQATAASVERLPDMVKFFSEKTGIKYPYPSYAQVFVQDIPNWSGNSTTATITENMVDDAPTHADFFYLWDLTEAEALAHQWFGSYLTARDWSHIWLNKAFARYLSGLYDEYKNGHEEFLLYQHLFDHTTYLNDWNAGSRQPIVTKHYEDAAALSADNYPYFRGASVLQMLRKHLGEDNWWRAVRHYVKSNANKAVTTEDFRKAIEEATGESMDWFFDQWLYKMGHPIFEVTQSYDATKQQLTLNVRQTQKVDPNEAHPQVEFFQGKVEVEIDGRIEPLWLSGKAENVFTFTSAQPPKLVNFDYESTWIKELKFEKSLDELLYQLQNDKDILGKNWAMSELVKLAKNEKTSAIDKARILTGLRSTVVSNAYWRLRLGAMSQLQGMLAPAWETKAFPLDDATITMLLTVIKNDKSWLRASAISFLGMTRDPKFVDVYLNALQDSSFRVINSAAVALGKSKSPKAFDALAKLKDKPAMKSQALISALVGLKELGDPRGFDIAFHALSDLKLLRWRLPTPPVWDYRVFAADTIVALEKGEAAYPMIFDRLKKSLAENDLEGIFHNVVLITKLADPRGQEAFDLVKAKFKDDANVMKAVNQYETQFKEVATKSIKATTGEARLIETGGAGVMFGLTEDEYQKLAAQLTASKSEIVTIKHKPETLSSQARFGVNFTFGGRTRSWAWDGNEKQGYVFYGDFNANGDLRDDTPRRFELKEGKHVLLLQLTANDLDSQETYPVSFKLVVSQIKPPGGTELRPCLLSYSETLREGTLQIGSQALLFRLTGSEGIYNGTYNRITFDLDGDGKLDPKLERYQMTERYVNIGETSYEFVVDRYGHNLTLKPLAEKLPPRVILLPGYTAPDFTFTDLDGKSRKLSDYRGKVVLLNFWGTWCGPCVAAVPKMVETYDQFHTQGFEIVGITSQDEEAQLRTFITEKKMTWLQTRETDDKGPIHKLYRITSWPTYILIGKDGKIVQNTIAGKDMNLAAELTKLFPASEKNAR